MPVNLPKLPSDFFRSLWINIDLPNPELITTGDALKTAVHRARLGDLTLGEGNSRWMSYTLNKRDNAGSKYIAYRCNKELALKIGMPNIFDSEDGRTYTIRCKDCDYELATKKRGT